MSTFLRPLASHVSAARMQFKRILKLAAALAAFWMLVFTNPVAASGPNLLVNGTFTNSTNDDVPDGWTATRWRVAGNGVESVVSYPYQWGAHPPGFDYVVNMECVVLCSDPNPLSQQVNGLIAGHQYQLTYSVAGLLAYAVSDDIPGQALPTGPLLVSLGSQQAPPVVVQPNPPWQNMPWVQQTYSFKYNSPSASALLTFLQKFSPAVTLGCYPCMENLWIANASLNDVTPTTPTLQVQEALGGNRVSDSDQFTVQILQNGSTVNAATNSTTTGTGSTVTAGTGTTGLTTLVTGTSYTITEAASGTTKLPQYSSTLACTDATGASKSLSLNTPFTLADNDAISCTLTNTPKAPTVRLSKALGTDGRINNADQFTVLVGQRLTTLASATTTGTGGVVNTGSTAWTSLVAGTSYSLSEVMTGTSVSSLGQYSAVLSCSNVWTGSPTVVPSAAPVAFTPTYGDVLDCTWTNKPAFASLTITQRAIVTAPATFNPPETFVYTGNNGWTSQSNSSSKVNTATPGATQNLAALNVATTLTVAVPTVERGWRIASIQCTDQNAAVSKNPAPPTVLASSTSNMVTIPANYVVNNAKLQCAVFASRQI